MFEDNPWTALAERYLPGGPGAVFTFGLNGGFEAGVRFIESVELASHLANVGDAKTLVIHPASTTHQQVPSAEREAAGIGDDMIRISVGLETIDDILADLDPGAGVGTMTTAVEIPEATARRAAPDHPELPHRCPGRGVGQPAALVELRGQLPGADAADRPTR